MNARGEPAAAVSAPAPAPAAAPVSAGPRASVADFRAVVALAREAREARLVHALENWVHLVKFERGRIEMRVNPKAPPALPGELSDRLAKWTGERWVVSVSSAEGEATLAEQEAAADQARRASAAQDPLLKAAMAAFPGARIVTVRDRDEFASETDSETSEGS
jgi:DNA polymerase-3 subunit gamma/tau